MTTTSKNNLNNAPSLLVTLVSFADAAIVPAAGDILREHAKTREFWLIVCDGAGFRMTEQIIRRYYWEAAPEDYFACVVPYEGVTFGVLILRKRLMTADR